MTALSDSMGDIRVAFGAGLDAFVATLPWLLLAMLVVVIGWRLARLGRRLAVRGGEALNGLLARFRRGRSARPALSQPLIALLGNVVFWLIVLLSVALAAGVAQIELFTNWLDRVIAYLPVLLAGGLILFVGYLVSSAARDLVSATLESAGSEQAGFFGLLAQAAIFLAALVIGLDQVGIDVTMLTILFGVIVGGLLLSLALAFGLGARSFVANLIAANQARTLVAIGQKVRIGEHEGTVVELTPTAVILASDEGRVAVPAMLVQEQVTLVRAGDDDD